MRIFHRFRMFAFCVFFVRKVEFQTSFTFIGSKSANTRLFTKMDSLSQLRQRRKEEDDTPTVSSRSLGKRLEKLDFYPKIDDDYVIKTESGGYGECSSPTLISSIFDLRYFDGDSFPRGAFAFHVCPARGQDHDRHHP